MAAKNYWCPCNINYVYHLSQSLSVGKKTIKWNLSIPYFSRLYPTTEHYLERLLRKRIEQQNSSATVPNVMHLSRLVQDEGQKSNQCKICKCWGIWIHFQSKISLIMIPKIAVFDELILLSDGSKDGKCAVGGGYGRILMDMFIDQWTKLGHKYV